MPRWQNVGRISKKTLGLLDKGTAKEDIVSNLELYPSTQEEKKSMPSAEGTILRGIRDQLVASLRNDLVAGLYEVGVPLRQEDIVTRYNVSRTPVREALIQLEHEGLVESTPNRGARVARQAPDSIHELLIPMRRLVEVYALRLIFDRLADVDFERWSGILDRMKDACARSDLAGVAQHDIAFHRSIIELADEPSLLRIWLPIVGQIRSYFLRSHSEYLDLMDVYREHAAIVETFRTGNRDEACRYLAARIGDPVSDAMIEDLMRLGDEVPPGSNTGLKEDSSTQRIENT